VKTEDEILFLSVGLMFAGATQVLSGVNAGYILISYAIGALIRDKQHTGKWFP